MEEVAVGRKEEVVEVPVADAKQVGDDAVARCVHIRARVSSTLSEGETALEVQAREGEGGRGGDGAPQLRM